MVAVANYTGLGIAVSLTGIIGIVGFTLAGMLPWWVLLVVILAGVLGSLTIFRDYIPGMSKGGGD